MRHSGHRLRRIAWLSAVLTVALVATADGKPYVVNTTADQDNGCSVDACSLREAVDASGASDTVMLAASDAPYMVTLGRILIDGQETIMGGGARTTIIDGNNENRLFGVIGADASLTLTGVTLQHGNVTSAAALIEGGAIRVDGGSLTLIDSALVDNKVVGTDPASDVYGAGLAIVSGKATLSGVLVKGNVAEGDTALGGGIANDAGALAIDRSTITLNTAKNGGGLWLGSGTHTLTGVTLRNNSATVGGGNLFKFSSEPSPVSLRATSVSAGNAPVGANCDGSGLLGMIVSVGGNLDSLNECGLGASEFHDTPPRLAALADNGGPTDTYAPLANSPVIDGAGACAAGELDQRGLPRPVTGCDIGSLEVQGPAATAAATQASALVGQPVGFSGSATDADKQDTTTLAWAFDDGATAAGGTVTHPFSTAGVHTATLTATDGYGKTATATATVEVTAPPPPPIVAPPIVPLPVLPAPDRTKPVVTKLKLTPKTFTRTSKIGFRLSEAASVVLTVERVVAGRRTRYVKLRGSIKHKGKAGNNSVRFSGRLGGRALTPNRYRLTVTATDAAGNRSKAVTSPFSVRARRGGKSPSGGGRTSD